ncbi:MAG: spermidine/putrescine ABC transporter substrate-binding protein [Clostridiaceae bacterium]|jgi:spermidine/putrescine transport system substrate-binding protein|nr:spermidine/putrescine ABC transporter substrate-binding protein [Clostridiaceae bacterium]
MKRILAIALACLVIIPVFGLLTGCNQNKVVLNIFNWGDYINNDLITKFEKETGIKINYEMFDTNETMLAKLETGGTDYDIIFPSDYIVEELIIRDMLMELDFNNIPNFKYVDNRFRNLAYDPLNKYSVPYFWGTLGILYNTDVVKEKVDSTSILFDEKHAGQIMMLDSMRDSIGITLQMLGYSTNSTNPAEINEAKELLIKQKPIINGYYVDEVVDMMINGDVAIALNWSGAAMEIYWQGVENIEYVIPREGTNMWVDCMVIPKTCRHKKEAEMFINFMLDPDNAFVNSEYVGYSSPVYEVTARMKEQYPEILEFEAYMPSDEALERCEFLINVGEAKALYNQAWLEIQAN